MRFQCRILHNRIYFISMVNDTHLSLCNSLNLAVEWKCVKTDLPIMFPTGNFKSRKSTLGMGRFSGIGPVRVLLPAPSVKSKLGRSIRKKGKALIRFYTMITSC